ncbi:APC family permease [Streptomyces yaizuensis]|uniref:APC family permease n=1 Tax=Streptomyces yaizuensis TaxID=2989713 RepID=A0ABQ5NUC1_9ACTN|nr:APC family permease [Streptomyces sp. YSPA8]GLF93963.1 APC family permease [Streptomyces sp. YSPA8]
MSSNHRASAENAPQLKRVLRLPAVVLFGLTYMSPVAVFTTYGIVNDETDGHLPAAYVLALAVMLLTAHSYGRMVRSFPAAGSAYKYSQKVFGGHVGFMTGWALMLDYLFLPMVSFLLAGIYLHAQFPGVPQAVWSVLVLLAVLVFNVLGVKFVSRITAVIMGATGLLLIAFVVLGATHSQVPAGDALQSFVPEAGQWSLLAGGAAILALSFLGFDAVSTLAEEAHDPRRTIPLGIILTTAIGGGLFILVAWIGSLVRPDNAFTDPDSAGAELMRTVGGSALSGAFTAVYVLGCFGSAMVSQASVSRIIFSMGRDGLLPRRVFGRLHPRFGTPVGALLAVSAVALLATVLTLDQAVVMINFGALAAFSMVNLSVLKHYLAGAGRQTGAHRSRARFLLVNGVLPALGFASTVWLWTSLTGDTFIVGVLWITAGLVLLAISTRFFTRRPPELHMDEEGSDPAPGPEEAVAPAHPASPR